MKYWKEGYDAYVKGLDYDDNPYPNESEAYDQWACGWMDAENGE